MVQNGGHVGLREYVESSSRYAKPVRAELDLLRRLFTGYVERRPCALSEGGCQLQ